MKDAQAESACSTCQQRHRHPSVPSIIRFEPPQHAFAIAERISREFNEKLQAFLSRAVELDRMIEFQRGYDLRKSGQRAA